MMSKEQSLDQIGHSMELFLSQDFDLRIPEVGDIYKGHVVSNNGTHVLVDIGAKSEGLVDPRELDQLDAEALEELTIGNEVPVYVTDVKEEQGQIILSYERALTEQDWLVAKDLYENQEPCESKIIGYNRGGLLTQIGNVRAFIPASQLGAPPHIRRDEDYLQQFVDQSLITKVIEVDRSRNRLILSAREAARKAREKQKAALLEELKVGDVYDGRVVNIEPFGAFVDIGGLQGLVHLSELSWRRVNSPEEEVEIGDEVQVAIIKIDEERKRVALSLKELQPDPWSIIYDHYTQGQLVEALITKIERYGAFARLEGKLGLEGLIHISEFSEDRINHPSQIVSEGETITVRIIRISPEERQLGLSIKQVHSAEYMELDLATEEN